MVKSDPKIHLPTSEELPCSDGTPVDSEDQNRVPNFLLFLLEFIWANRQDWYFGADMAIYHTTGVSPLVPAVPDGFLSLGVERRKGGGSRFSYVLWEENNVPPISVIEMVSHTYGGGYDTKKEIYANLGVLYYLVYNPQYWRRDRQQPFELYRQGRWQLPAANWRAFLDARNRFGNRASAVAGRGSRAGSAVLVRPAGHSVPDPL